MTTDVSESTAQAAAVGPAASAVESLLVIRVAGAWLAIAAEMAEEICAAERPTPVPRVPDHIPGLINLRGYAVPLLDLQRFLALAGEVANAGGGGRQAANFSRIVIVVAGRMRVGLLCDRVRGVAHVERAREQPVRVTQGERLREFARAEIDDPDGLVVVLDLPRILSSARVGK